MAKIGLNNFRYAILTEAEDGTPSYDGAKKPAKAISCNVDITNNDASLYADDVLSESDTSFQSGTVTMGIDDEDIATMAALLGHTVTDGEMVRNANDTAPYVGFGRVIVKMVGGVHKYKVEFLCKVKFAEPSQEDNTKGESLEFGTSEIEGTVSALADGKWSVAKTFDTKAAAIEYLEELMAAPGPKLTGLTVYGDSSPTLSPAFSPSHMSYTLVVGSSSSAAQLSASAGQGVTISFFKGSTAKSTGNGIVDQTINGDSDEGDWTIVVGSGDNTTTYNITVQATA